MRNETRPAPGGGSLLQLRRVTSCQSRAARDTGGEGSQWPSNPLATLGGGIGEGIVAEGGVPSGPGVPGPSGTSLGGGFSSKPNPSLRGGDQKNHLFAAALQQKLKNPQFLVGDFYLFTKIKSPIWGGGFFIKEKREKPQIEGKKFLFFFFQRPSPSLLRKGGRELFNFFEFFVPLRPLLSHSSPQLRGGGDRRIVDWRGCKKCVLSYLIPHPS